MTSAPRHRAVSHLSRARYAVPGRPGSPGEPPASTPTWRYPPTVPTRPARWSSSPKARPRLPASGGPIVICRGRALPARRSRNRDPPGGGGLSHHACFEPRSGRRCPGRHRGSAGRPGNQQNAPRAGGGAGASDAGGSSGQRGKPQPVAWLVADLAGLAAQHCVLMPEDQELGFIGHLTPGPNHQAAEHTAHEEVDDREEHSAMFPARRPARSISRASQGESATARSGAWRSRRAPADYLRGPPGPASRAEPPAAGVSGRGQAGCWPAGPTEL
jgi:hypothetical protein